FSSIARDVQRFYDTATGANKGGYKQWKRWEWFAQHHLDNQGRLAQYGTLNKQAAIEMQRQEAARGGTSYTGNWQSIGHTTISGNTMAKQGRVNCIAFDPVNSAIMYAGSCGGGIWKTTNGGLTWQTTTPSLPIMGISDIVVAPAPYNNVIYALTGEGMNVNVYLHKGNGVIKSIDGGATWFEANNGMDMVLSEQIGGYRLLMHPTNPDILIATTSNGIYRTTNGAVSWEPLLTGFDINDIAFKPNNPDKLYFVVQSFSRFYAMDLTNLDYDFITIPTAQAATKLKIGVSPAEGNSVYVLAGPGFQSGPNNRFNGLFYSSDSGTTFTQRSNSIASNVAFMNAGSVDLSFYTNTLYVSPTDINTVLLGSLNLVRSIDGGTTLSHVTGTTIHSDQHAIRRNPITGHLWLCNDGGLYQSTDNGVSFTNRSEGLVISEIYRTSSSKSSPNEILCGLQDNGHMYRAIFPSVNWYSVLGGDGMDNMYNSFSSNVAYACAQNAGLAKSINGGVSFTTVGGLPNNGNTANYPWISPIVQHPPYLPLSLNLDVLYVYGLNGIERSLDGGNSFTNIGPAGISATWSSPSMVIGTDDGGLSASLYISNGNNFWVNNNPLGAGNNWINRPLPIPAGYPTSAIAVNPANKSDVVVTIAGYDATHKVWRSTNGGFSWFNISASLPNVPVYSVVFGNAVSSPSGAIYVGTEIGVFYKDDNLSGWLPYSNLLPRVPVVDLDINYTSGVLRAATYGRGLWETDLYQACVPNLAIPFTLSGGQHHYEASNELQTTAIISGGFGTQVTMRASNRVVLSPGFKVTNGAYFRAINAGCATGPMLPNVKIVSPKIQSNQKE
ncbi:MAG: 3-coathanger stack domain-containing protein, partial [Ferruginibacter sp.]